MRRVCSVPARVWCAQPNFMGETCPAACDWCSNAGLLPTPAVFQLDFVCKDKLATKPSGIAEGLKKGSMELPDGCTFRCRDNMTASVCATVSAEGLCEKKATAQAARYQCAQTCGICKALELQEPASATPYPKHACSLPEGDSPAHKASCAGWASSGEWCARAT